MSARSLVSLVFLSVVLVFAGVLATDWAVWWLAPLWWLGRYQAFHVVAHFGIFAGVVLFYYPQQHSGIRLWIIVVSGSVLLEWVQVTVGGFSLTKPLLLDSFLDIVVDIAGAAVCWFWLTHHHQMMQSIPDGEIAETLSKIGRRLSKS